ncbi:hypothetical protein DFH11DRAFT_1728671 [Phellopilus nigrolimitatus]|nr:hypothetical protein DFH11DRAFT_1728671 [Phellopilus nigrolimitatus]
MPLAYAEALSHPYTTSTVPNMYGVGNPVSAAYADYVLTHFTRLSLSSPALLPSRATLSRLCSCRHFLRRRVVRSPHTYHAMHATAGPPRARATVCDGWASRACDAGRPRVRVTAGLPRSRATACDSEAASRAYGGVRSRGPILMRARTGPLARARGWAPEHRVDTRVHSSVRVADPRRVCGDHPSRVRTLRVRSSACDARPTHPHE